ncbi:MAG: DUF3618 domain-containing protein [Myxococcales bacterium]|nr:DUF3618 domain-containing protein [Myxococcales bacterium]
MNGGKDNEGKTPATGAASSASAAEAQTEALKQSIDRTRSDIGETLTAIEEKLEPARLREKALEELEVVEHRVKGAVKEQFEETKAAIKLELIEAKDSVKKEVQQGLAQAKDALRAATIGKVENMARVANERTIEARDSILDTIWNNPLPAALAGIGLTWLYMNRRASQPRGYEYYGSSGWRRPAGGAVQDYVQDLRDDAGGALQGAKDAAGGALRGAKGAAGRAMHEARRKASDFASAAGQTAEQASRTAGEFAHDTADAAGRLAHRVSDGASHLVEEAGEMTSELTERAGRQIRRVDDWARETVHDNPLAVAATCMAAGALLGLALPRTEREDELMGEARDQLVDRAVGLAQEGMERAHHVANSLEELKNAAEPKPESRSGGRS